jgi:hypothetical protein
MQIEQDAEPDLTCDVPGEQAKHKIDPVERA